MFDQMKELFASSQKRSDEQEKIMNSLAKQVKTLTAGTKSRPPYGITKVRSSRRLDFATPGNQAAIAEKSLSGNVPDETILPGAQPIVKDLPPPVADNDADNMEHVDPDS
ncbi:hypothetical protein Bca101_058971 [Brassica carinata]